MSEPQTQANQPIPPVDVIANSALAPAGLFQLIIGHYGTQAIATLARLEVVDALADGPRTAADLAPDVGADPRALYRLLRTVASLGVLEHRADDTFAITEAAQMLRRDQPFTLRDFAMLQGVAWHWDPWARAVEAVREGRSQFTEHHGVAYYEHLERDPRASDLFAAAMSNLSSQAQFLALPLHDFTGYGTVVDVAGGEGEVLAAVLQGAPAARGVLFDRPRVVDNGLNRLAKAGLADRVEGIAGDMFDEVPSGGDCYLLSMVVNDYGDEDAGVLLRNCRQAMTAQARLVLLDMVLPPRGTPSFASLGDFECLVVSGGQMRTEEELRALLAGAGFRLTAVRKDISPVCVVEAVPE